MSVFVLVRVPIRLSRSSSSSSSRSLILFPLFVFVLGLVLVAIPRPPLEVRDGPVRARLPSSGTIRVRSLMRFVHAHLWLAGLASTGFLVARPAQACLCAREPSEPDVIFQGRVASIERVEACEDPKWSITAGCREERRVCFDVARTVRGAAEPTRCVYTGVGGGDCGVRFREGETWVVRAGVGFSQVMHELGVPPGSLGTGICQHDFEGTLDGLPDPTADPGPAVSKGWGFFFMGTFLSFFAWLLLWPRMRRRPVPVRLGIRRAFVRC